MKRVNVRVEFLSARPPLRQCWVAILAVLALATLAGCPRAETRDDILAAARWALVLSQDGEGGVPPVGHRAWQWGFNPPEGAARIFKFPGSKLTSIMPYEWQGEELVIDSPVTVSYFRESGNIESEFDSLRPGDVFGHMEVSLRLTGRSQSPSRPHTMTGSYVFSFTEEWGGETFSGTFEGEQSFEF